MVGKYITRKYMVRLDQGDISKQQQYVLPWSLSFQQPLSLTTTCQNGFFDLTFPAEKAGKSEK